jgi:hypothetical protein
VFVFAGLLLLLAPGMQVITLVYAERANFREILNSPANQSHQSRMIAQYGSIEAWLNTQLPMPAVLDTLFDSLVRPARFGRMRANDLVSMSRLSLAAALIWPWATLAALMVFRFSMRRARVSTVHVVRCLVYAFDPLPLTVATLLAAIVLSSWPLLMLIRPPRRHFGDEDTMLTVLVLIGCSGLLFCCYRLWRAYQLYLRFDHSFWTVLASQAIVWLLFLNVLLVLTMG